MPKPIAERRCPHCNAELPEPKPMSCPQCAGSLRQRYLRYGCLTSAPKLVLFGFAAWLAWHALA